MSTDGNLPDLKFPQTGGQGNAIHLSANTLKQHGRNGTDPTPRQTRVYETLAQTKVNYDDIKLKLGSFSEAV